MNCCTLRIARLGQSPPLESKVFKTPFKVLAFTISSNSPLLRSQSLSTPARRLAQVRDVAVVIRHVPTIFKIYRAFSHNSATRMPPIEKPIEGEKYDVVFIGGGSGGSAGSVSHVGA